MRIKTTDLYVDNQDKALGFYRDTLGMIVKDDVRMSDSFRWLSVVSPEAEDGIELVLQESGSDNGSKEFQKQQYDAGRPVLSIEVDDIQTSYDQLSAKGVKFAAPPKRQDYGGIDAVMDDGCGNLINLHQKD